MPQTNDVTVQQGQYVQANGLNIYYEEFGGGEPLILLHGAMGTGATQWETHIPFLSSHFRVIMPDARGHGKTDSLGEEIRLPMLTDDVAAFIDTLNLGESFFCGWSTGGDTAIDLGMRYPNLVRAMVVGGVVHRVTETYLESLRAMGVEGPGEVNAEQTEGAMPQFVELLRAVHPKGPDYWITLLTQLSHKFTEPTLPPIDSLRKMAAPTLIIWGDRDQFLPVEQAVELYRLIPNAELAVVPNADHSVCRAKAELFANLAREFLLRHTASAKGDGALADAHG
jgi:pimeloyl-ACP methyl ester carboxylesterase